MEKMKVIKIGGSTLHKKRAVSHIMDLMCKRGPGHIFVLSALYGVTDFLIDGMLEALKDEEQIPEIIRQIRTKHMALARPLIPKRSSFKAFTQDFDKSLGKLEGLYYGLNFSKEVTPPIKDVISSYGERFAVMLLSCALRSRGLKSAYFMPKQIGLLTDGKFGDATADLLKTSRNFQKSLKPFLKSP